MSDTYKRIKSEIISGMKEKNSEKVLALRTLDSNIKNIAITNLHKDGPTEEDVLQGLSQIIKRGTDSAEQFQKGNREDLVKIELFQVNLAKSFLPKQMTREELKEKISANISLNFPGTLSQKDFGKLMKSFGEMFRGLTDNKTISEVIKEIFTELGVK